MCDNCISQGMYCVLGCRVACRACNQHKVCSFLDGKRKHKGEEIVSEDGELGPKKAKVLGTRPSGSKPKVEVLVGLSGVVDPQPISKMTELLQEVIRSRDLSKVTWSLVGLSIHMHKQNAEMIRLRKWQVFLAEHARKVGLGSGLGMDLGTEKEEGRETGKDKGKGKKKETEGNDETLGKSDGDLGLCLDEEEDGDMRMDE
jgi:hypothetical protein